MKNKLSKFVTKEYITKVIVSVCLLTLLLLSFLFADKLETLLGMKISYSKNQVAEDTLDSASYKVSYLDVGQGNCTLIELPDNRVALIDGGNTSYGDKVYKYLQEKEIEVIDFLIATHADTDHIGGLNYLFSRMQIKNIYRPFQIAGTGDTADTFVPIVAEDLKEVYNYYASDSNNKISRVTSSVYHEFITNIYSETYAENGNTYKSKVTVFYDEFKIVGSTYTFEFYAPLKRDDTISLLSYSGTYGYATMGFGVSISNDNSAIFTFTCGNDSYLFTGDASCKNSSGATANTCGELAFVSSLTTQEKQKLANVSVYLAGHHGSENSSSSALLNLINPKFVVISVAKENDFGHPSAQTLERIKDTKNLEDDYLLCTDECGTIIFSNASGKLCYVISGFEEDKSTFISYELFATIVFVFLIIIVFSIKPKKQAKDKIIDTKRK